MTSFLMEMTINCVRGFFQGFVHGSFANRHDFQIVALLLVDTFIIILTIKFRLFFADKIIFALTFVYLVLYFLFDLFLSFFTYQTIL